MPLVIENQGKGFIGEIGAGWRVSQNGSPAILGDSAGRLGSLTFSATCDSSTKFTIDNYLSVQHMYDSQTARWLSTFDGYIRDIETNGKTGRFTMASILSALDVERTSSIDVFGTYQRAFQIPAGTEYTIASTTYTVGGYWTSVGSENVFVPRPTLIRDITASTDYIYVLADGQHLGEVVIRFGLDGIFSTIWPVYSDATDLASPDSHYISYADGNLWIAQVNADRIKRFDVEGNFISQWGSAGSGDGQFNTITGIAVNGYGLNAVYVVDSVLARVQCFTETGTYLFKWGTPGTFPGNTIFNAPNGISIDPITDQVFVSDRNARVRAYTSGGGYVTQPMGSYDFNTNTSTGEFQAGGNPIRTAFDHLGNAYAIQLGKVYKYVRDNAGWDTSIHSPIRELDVGSDELDPPDNIAISPFMGIIHVARSTDFVDQYAGSLGQIEAYFLYYIALAGPDFPVRLLSPNNEWDVGELAFISWTGNVWNQLCDLCAATSNSMVAFDERLMFINRANRNYRLPDDVVISPVKYESRAAGRAIEIVNQNSVYTAGQDVLYSAQADNERVFSVDVNSFTYVTVSQNSYPEFVNDPVPSTTLGSGKYIVVDANLLVVTPTLWTNYGGMIRADVGKKPGTILLTFIGPSVEIPGFEAPYKIATIGNEPSLNVTGAGVLSDPEVLTIGTGASEEISNRAVAQTIDSPFAFNAEIAYSEGSWAAYNAGTPNQRVTFTLRPEKSYLWSDTSAGVAGTFQFMGTIIEYDDAQYIVEDLDITASGITLSCYRYTKAAWESNEIGNGIGPRLEEIWGGRAASQFDAYWADYTAQDVTVAPLRNPFGV